MSIRPLPQRGLRLSRLHSTLAAVTLASLAACGGGGSETAATTPGSSTATPDQPNPVPTTPTVTPSTPAPTPVAAPVTVTGKVMIRQGIQGATVCIDLNANSTCDTGEPTSPPTGVDGSYTLSYPSSSITAEQLASAPMLAMIPSATAIDAALPSATVAAKDIVLSAPPGVSAQINPLTTLLQAGVASGLSQTKASAAVALQMGVKEAEILDYQSVPLELDKFTDNARTMAVVVSMALADSVKLEVVDLGASTSPGVSLASLSYTDANNYQIRTYSSEDKGATGLVQIGEDRSGRSGGSFLPDSAWYASAYLTDSGWVRCSRSGFVGTRGRPSRSDYCGGGVPSVGYTKSVADVSGKSMFSVLTDMATNIVTNTVTVNPSFMGSKVFPTGTTLTDRVTINLGQALYVTNVNTLANQRSATSIEDFILRTRAAPLNPINASGMNWMGNIDATHWLFQTFTDATSKVQYYTCTYNAAGAVTGCVALNEGSFAIDTYKGVRKLSFSNAPATMYHYDVTFCEYSGAVARCQFNRADLKSATSGSQRFNTTGLDALRTALGI